MSTEAAAKFFDQLAKDSSLQAELGVRNETKDERIAAAVELGKKNGFDFSAEECKTVLATAKKVHDGELEDAEIEAVAGGGWLLDLGAWLQREVDSLFGDDDDDDEDSDQGSTAVAGVRG